MSRRVIPIVLALSCSLLHAQNQTISGVTSTYTVTLPAGFTGATFSTLSLDVNYPVGLPAGSYIPVQRLNADFQGFISAYPNPADAPEAYLSIALQQIMSKYPQITFGSLLGTMSAPGTTVPGTTVTIPGNVLGTITVAIGNYPGNLGLPSSSAGAVSYIFSTHVVTLPTGFTGTAFSSLSLGTFYPTGLNTGSYITTNQLNSDFQKSISTYPSPTDPPEAYLSVALQQILNKYSQIQLGTLSGLINGPGTTIPGTPITMPGPLIGSVGVIIGTPSAAFGSLYGLTGTVSLISSTWTVTLPAAFTSNAFSLLTLGVTYPTGLNPGSYVPAKQLNSDFQGFITANSSPTDAPEAFLSSSLQQILNKYTQMTGGATTGEINGPDTTYPGTNITTPGPLIGTVEVFIGTYNPVLGLTLLAPTISARSAAMPRLVPTR
jgi:hypothetical protein